MSLKYEPCACFTGLSGVVLLIIYLSGEGVIFDPQQVLGPYVWPTVGAYEPTRHLRDRESFFY